MATPKLVKRGLFANLRKSSQKQQGLLFCFEFTAEQYIRTRLREEKRDSFVNFYLINDGYDIAEVANNIRQLYKEGVKFFLIDSQMRLSAPQREKYGRGGDEQIFYSCKALPFLRNRDIFDYPNKQE